MPQSTANPDFAFEVGKSYTTYSKKSYITITKRSACYVSGVEKNGGTFRRKILKYAATYEYNGDGKVFECFILHEHVHVSARDEVQPEITASAEFAQHDNLYDDDSFSDAPGDNSSPNQDIPVSLLHDSIPADNTLMTVIPSDEAILLREAEHSPAMDIDPEDRIREPYFPPQKSITVWPADLGSFAFSYKHAKNESTLLYSVRLVEAPGAVDSNFRIWKGHYMLMFYNNKSESLRPFACFSPMLGILQFTPYDPVFAHNFNIQQKFISHFMPFLHDVLRNAGMLDHNGEIISDGLEAFRVLYYKATALDRSADWDNFIMPDNPFSNENDRDNPLSWPESHYRTKALRIMHNIMFYTVETRSTWRHNKSAVKKINSLIQSLTDDLHRLFDAQNLALHTDNNGFTVVPSEHITHPDYYTYQDSIHDYIPCVNVPACDFQSHSPAAVVPYEHAAPIRYFFRLINIFIRLWLAVHISLPVLLLEDFPDGIFTHYKPRKKTRAKFRRAVFEVGSSYSATAYSPSKGLLSYTFLVTGRCVYEDTIDHRKGVMLFVTCNHPEKPDFESKAVLRFINSDHGVEVYNSRLRYKMGYGDIIFSFRADKIDNVPHKFIDTTPCEPDCKPRGYATRFISRQFLNFSDDAHKIIHAEIRDVTPNVDNQHSIIDLRNLQGIDYKNAMLHNKKVISQIMFQDALTALLLDSNIFTLRRIASSYGFRHCKGQKLDFARLIALVEFNRRKLHAMETRQAKNHTPHHNLPPDNVKVFTNDKRQICFLFED